MSDPITDTDFIDAHGLPALGPVYFSSRRFAEEKCRDWSSEDFRPLVEKAAETFAESLQEGIENWLISNVESNVQGHIWHTVDQIVRGLLSGEKWVMSRYLLGERYDCGTVRATVAQHITDDLARQRIADLEAQIERLEKDLQWERRERF